MLLYAVRDPMLMSESSVETMSVTMMERKGISQLSGTWSMLV